MKTNATFIALAQADRGMPHNAALRDAAIGMLASHATGIHACEEEEVLDEEEIAHRQWLDHQARMLEETNPDLQ